MRHVFGKRRRDERDERDETDGQRNLRSVTEQSGLTAHLNNKNSYREVKSEKMMDNDCTLNVIELGCGHLSIGESSHGKDTSPSSVDGSIEIQNRKGDTDTNFSFRPPLDQYYAESQNEEEELSFSFSRRSNSLHNLRDSRPPLQEKLKDSVNDERNGGSAITQRSTGKQSNIRGKLPPELSGLLLIKLKYKNIIKIYYFFINKIKIIK
jgi:hypothetical protein